MNKEKSLVSIILPVYNAENYLDLCMQSITSQSYQNLEIIIVNDGSSDASWDYIEKWRANDCRIIAISQNNAGSGPARNCGLDHAHGEYVMFVDPDDWIDSEMVYQLITKMSNSGADYLVSGYKTHCFSEDVPERVTDTRFDSDFISDVGVIHDRYLGLLNANAVSSPWGKVYKRRLIELYNIRFPALRRSQDIVFNYLYYSYISSLYIDDSCYYHYRVNVRGYGKKVPGDYYLSVSRIANDITALLHQWSYPIENNAEYITFCNHFFEPLASGILSGKAKHNLHDIVNNSGVSIVCKYCQPKFFSRRLIRFLILRRWTIVLRLLIFVHGGFKES